VRLLSSLPAVGGVQHHLSLVAKTQGPPGGSAAEISTPHQWACLCTFISPRQNKFRLLLY